MKQKKIQRAAALVALVLCAQAAAQNPRPHLTALRQQLNLSANLKLEWQPSTNGPDSVLVIDDFNRAGTGSDWLLDNRFWAIENNEIVLNDSSPSEWRYLAVFKPIFNTVSRKMFSVSYRWGRQADSVSIGEGAFAMLINKRSFKGDGYWLWRRTNQKSVWLYAIKNGVWEYTPGETKEYNRRDARLPIPKAGDLITAAMRNEVHSMFFDYYINDHLDATVQDTSKEFARQDTAYFGLFMHGMNLNNMIDDFTLTWLTPDTVPPAAITNLRAVDSSITSITLAWTATGDNYWDGTANAFDLRYATFPLTAANFSTATPAPNIVLPATSGTPQQFVVTSLQSNTRYYFAMRVYDEANNVRGISNIAQAATPLARIATSLQLVEGCEQTGSVGATLARPLTVRVKDQLNAPFAGYAVQFQIKNGEAHFSNGATTLITSTDNNGEANTTLTLGTIPGTIALEISAAGLSNSPLSCNAFALVGALAELVQVSGNLQLLSAGKLSAPLVVRATDRFGNSVANVATRFAITKGGGRFGNDTTSFSTNTATNGLASAELFASEVAGDTTIVAVTLPDSLSNTQLQTSFLIFSAAADSLIALGGDQQTDTVGTQLAEPLVVRVLDAFGAPVKNFSMAFKVIAGGGVLSNGSAIQDAATDTEGTARTTWTLGPNPGLNQVKVEALGLKGAPFTFQAIGIRMRGVATALQLVEGCDQTGSVGAMLARPLTVRVQDQFNEPFAGYAVQFQIKNGEAHFANGATTLTTSTNSSGEASATLTLGTSPGTIALEISGAGLSNSPISCSAFAITGAPAKLSQVSGNLQFLSASLLAAPLVVRATDQFGNSAANFSTLFTIARGGGKFVNGGASFFTSTAANGSASAELYASDVAGDTTNITVTLRDSLTNALLQTNFFIYTAPADSLLALGGDQQTDTVGTQLAAPLVVRVNDVFGTPVKNFMVTFRVIEGGGLLGNGSAVQTHATDNTGTTQTTWKLGANPGLNRVTVEANGLHGSPITFRATGLGVSAVAENPSAMPKEFALLQNTPNPFNPTTTIRFTLPEPAEVTLTIFDVSGRLVRELVQSARNAGVHQVQWEGRDAHGHALQSGVYLYRMLAVGKASGKSFHATRKLVLAK